MANKIILKRVVSSAKQKEIQEEKENSQEIEVKNTEQLKEKIEKIKFDIEGKLLFVKVGSPESKEDNKLRIQEIQDIFTEMLEKFDINCLVFVSDYDVDIKILP